MSAKMWFFLCVFSVLIFSALGQEQTEAPDFPTGPEVTALPITTPIPETTDPPEENSEETDIDPPDTTEPSVPTVTISQGTVIGAVAESGDYFEFYGIPYADSTSGIHRFKAPSSPPNFQDDFIADRKGIQCVTANGVGYDGVEDCLVVNVFTTTLDNTRQLPVMVWIKGRELNKIDYNLSFRHFLDKDVIVVEINFRESILGFLCLGTEIAPGNAGLKDIIAGLRWIQENIAQFGGDPDNVSIFGHGSGAAAVDLITMSPLSEGLVHKAIAQSGNAFAPWAVSRDNLEYAIKVAEALGHTIISMDELSVIFTRASVAALMAVINELDLTDNSLAFAPCVERESLQNVEHFLTKSPYQTIIDGEQRQIPFMTGFVDNEGTIRAEQASEWIERMDSSFIDFIQPDLKFENAEDEEEVGRQIKSFYFGEEEITMSNYFKYHGETMILVSALRESILRAQTSTQPIYVYQFSYNGILGGLFVGDNIVESAAHSEELAYLFYDSPDTAVTELDLTVSDILIERWTNFAKAGQPNSETSPQDWQPFTLESPTYLRFLDVDEIASGNLEIVGQNPHSAAVAFWQQIYDGHFLDAEGKWELSDRIEGEDVIVVDDFEEEEASGEEPDDSLEVTTEFPDEGDPEDEDGSATTAVGCTFLIITLFSLLGQFHWSQILS